MQKVNPRYTRKISVANFLLWGNSFKDCSSPESIYQVYFKILSMQLRSDYDATFEIAL